MIGQALNTATALPDHPDTKLTMQPHLTEDAARHDGSETVSMLWLDPQEVVYLL